jgi:phenylalanyl-tRNA synthetase beta chain
MQGNVRLFEIGTAFFAGEDQAALPGPKKAALPREEMHVGALIMGQRAPTHFTRAVQPSYDEWDIKFLAERAAAAAYPEAVIELVPGSGEILWEITVNRAKVGTARRLKLDAPVWAKPAFGLEINLEAAEQTSVRHKTYRAIPATPRVQVDLALLAPISVTAAQMDAVIRREAGELLESLTLFDEFVGQGIQEGSRSLAWALTFRDAERTLKDQEVQGRTAKIVKALEGELGVRQRTA